MKTITITTILLVVAKIIFAQTFSTVKVDTTTGNIIFGETIPIDSANKSQLYSKAREWFTINFKSANAVLQMDDKEDGKLIGKAWQDITALTGLGTKSKVKMWYTISIYVKDNKFKYSISNITYQNYPSEYDKNPIEQRAEEIITEEKIKKAWMKLRKEETLRVVNELSDSIKKAMTTKNKGASGDW